MPFRSSKASQDQDWRLSGSPNLGMGKHMTNPVGTRALSTHYELFSPSTEQYLADIASAKTKNEEPQRQGIPPSYGTRPNSGFHRPPLSSPPSYRAAPTLSANDPLLIPQPSLQVGAQASHPGSHNRTFNQARYSVFPQHGPGEPARARNEAEVVEELCMSPNTHPLSDPHERVTPSATGISVDTGMGITPTTGGSSVDRSFVATTARSQNASQSKLARSKHIPRPIQQPADKEPELSKTLTKTVRPRRESSPHEILFRVNSNHEVSPEPVKVIRRPTPKIFDLISPTRRFRDEPSLRPLNIVNRAMPKVLDLISPTRALPTWNKHRDMRMKPLPPVPATSSQVQPSVAQQDDLMTPDGQGVSHERTALSLALQDDEEWRAQRVSIQPPVPQLPLDRRRKGLGFQ
jgi:hypothetical protein